MASHLRHLDQMRDTTNIPPQSAPPENPYATLNPDGTSIAPPSAHAGIGIYFIGLAFLTLFIAWLHSALRSSNSSREVPTASSIDGSDEEKNEMTVEERRAALTNDFKANGTVMVRRTLFTDWTHPPCWLSSHVCHGMAFFLASVGRERRHPGSDRKKDKSGSIIKRRKGWP